MPSLNIYIDNEGSDHCNQKNPKKRKNNLIGLSIFFCNALLKITKKKKNHLIVYPTLIFFSTNIGQKPLGIIFPDKLFRQGVGSSCTK